MPKPLKLAWGIRKEGRSLWTRNAVKGVSVRAETVSYTHLPLPPKA